jgi:hypothetical protein
MTATTTRANSLLFMVTSDWSAATGARTYRDSATERGYHNVGSAYTSMFYTKAATSTGSYTEGLTAPSMGTGAGSVLVEIRTP